jgi:hypothetical protein
MNAMWIPVGSAGAIILLSLGVLEVMSEGVRVDQSSTGARRFWENPAHLESALLDAPDDFWSSQALVDSSSIRAVAEGDADVDEGERGASPFDLRVHQGQ